MFSSYDVDSRTSGNDIVSLGNYAISSKCKSVNVGSNRFLYAKRKGSVEDWIMFYPKACGYTYNICANILVNYSDKDVWARVEAKPDPGESFSNRPITNRSKIPAKSSTPVTGALGGEIIVYDADAPAGKILERIPVPKERCGLYFYYRDPTKAPTPYPTPYPTPFPTPHPTSNPTKSPTPYPTSAPTAGPTVKPTKKPTNAPNYTPTPGPTKAPTKAPTVAPTKAPVKPPPPPPPPSGGCGSIKGCFLVSLDNKGIPEVKLGGSVSYDPSVAEYSVRCDTEGTINKVTFQYPNGEKSEHVEWAMPWWMRGDSGGRIHQVSYLSRDAECGSKKFTVTGEIWTGKCFEETFELEAHC